MPNASPLRAQWDLPRLGPCFRYRPNRCAQAPHPIAAQVRVGRRVDQRPILERHAARFDEFHYLAVDFEVAFEADRAFDERCTAWRSGRNCQRDPGRQRLGRTPRAWTVRRVG